LAERPPERPPSRPRPSAQGPARTAGEPSGAGGLPLWAVAAIVVVVGFLVWLLFIRDDDSGSGSSTGAQAQKSVDLASAQGLPAEVSGVDYPVYWLGPRSGVNYEVTVITDGRAYVRYLPKGVEAQSPDPYLTVGSYSQANAFDVLKGLAKGPGHSIVKIPDGGLALKYGPKTQGVYVAFPGVDTQIELYDPRIGRALELAKSGALSEIR
jgi:hypothetical protein